MIKGKMDKDEWMRKSCDEIRMKKKLRDEGLQDVVRGKERGREEVRKRIE